MALARPGQDVRSRQEVDLVEQRIATYCKRADLKRDLFTGDPLPFSTTSRFCKWCGGEFAVGGDPRKKYCGEACCKKASNHQRALRDKAKRKAKGKE